MIKVPLLLIGALVVCIFFAGCTGSSGSSNTSAAEVTTAPPIAPLYATGDVVKNPKSASTVAYLILGYDSASDAYERALIYPNADGSWGYRMNSVTSNFSRESFEKTYTNKVANVDPSTVTIGIPTAVATTVPVTVATTSAVSTTVTTAATGLKPSIRDILPDSGYAGTTVSITQLVGSSFEAGATVNLSKSGFSNIPGTNVVVNSPTDISCTFVIPASISAGTWDVVVTNPEGLSATYSNLFSIHTTGTSDSSSGSTSNLTITSTDPHTFVTGGAAGTVRVKIYGSNFPTNPTVLLRKAYSSDITGTSIYMPTTSEVDVSFNIPTGSAGTWSIVFVSSDRSTTLATYSNALTVS